MKMEPGEEEVDHDHWFRKNLYQWRDGDLYVNGTRVRPETWWEWIRRKTGL